MTNQIYFNPFATSISTFKLDPLANPLKVLCETITIPVIKGLGILEHAPQSSTYRNWRRGLCAVAGVLLHLAY